MSMRPVAAPAVLLFAAVVFASWSARTGRTADERRDQTGKNPDTITTKHAAIKLKLIPAVTFMMGSPDGTGGEAEHPRHRVRISRPFYLGVTEVTRGQFRQFVADTHYGTEAETDGKGSLGFSARENKIEFNGPFTWRSAGFDQTDEHPVVNVSWNDAMEFCKWLSRVEGRQFRLPTEAEWEYACRAGTTSTYSCGDNPEKLATVGNVADGTARRKHRDWVGISAKDGYIFTAPVGRFRANAFGLHDMHGNVWEWCSDRVGEDYYQRSPEVDPAGDAGSGARVDRGGGWMARPELCRSANRSSASPSNRTNSLGFRIAAGEAGQ